MARSVLISLLLILTMSNMVATFPVEYFDNAFWQMLHPKCKISLVEHCYYNRVEWQHKYSPVCHLIANTSIKHTIAMEPEILQPMHALYKDYVKNEKNDYSTVLEYFLKHRYHLQLGNRTDRFVTRREVNSQTYYNRLMRAQHHIDYCLDFEKRHLPLPTDCTFLDDIELVEHCGMHHAIREYKPCYGISYPEIAQPVDTVTLCRYIAWKNVTSAFVYPEWEHQIVGIWPAFTIVLDCLHTNKWRKDPSHQCHDIAYPLQGVKYGKLHARRQEMYKTIGRKDIERDCSYFHQDEIKAGVGPCAKYSDSMVENKTSSK